MNRWLTLSLALTAFAALLLRWPQPGQRPMHNDEAVNGVKFCRLWEHGDYRYDPNEHHGPTLYYFTSWASTLTGAPRNAAAISEERLRWVTVIFGLGLIALLPLLADGLGRTSVVWAAIFTALSPAFVFYSQYYIHEMLLVFFATSVLVCGWRYWLTRRIPWIICAGLSLGLMAATKETFVLSVAAAVMALVANQLWNRMLDASQRPLRAPPLKLWHLALGAGCALLSAVLFFSSFFQNASGPMDAIRTYAPWLARAGGDSPHLHPWYFYWERMLFFRGAKGPIWSEGFILALAVVGGYAGFRRKGTGDSRASLLRFLVFYSCALAAIYGIIWYKTPWCMLNFWHGFILLAGAGAAWISRNVRSIEAKLFCVVLLAAGCTQLVTLAKLSVNRYAAETSNPYVYAQTSQDVARLVDKVNTLSSFSSGTNTLIKVIGDEGDYWPLPWYLRGCGKVGWWEAMPEDPYAPLMIISAKLNARLDEQSTNHLMAGYFQLRPSNFLELYVDLDVWTRHLQARPEQPSTTP